MKRDGPGRILGLASEFIAIDLSNVEEHLDSKVVLLKNLHQNVRKLSMTLHNFT